MIKTKYLIIGNGIAGLSAAKEIRSIDESGTITMVSSEEYLTYYRMRLTEGLNKNFKEEDLLVNSKSWYEEKNINVMLRRIVDNIDVNENSITLDDGQKLTYEKLLIATGSRPFIPPINGKFKEGVFALRSLRDLNYIKNYFENRERLVVIGGGLLGLEAAWALKNSGKNVSVIEYAPYLLPRQLDKELGTKLANKLHKEGIKVHLPKAAEEILGEGEATGITISGEDVIKADGILISSGIRPNLDLVRETDIKSDKGIIVDNNLKTSIDNIYAAGDVIQIDDKVIGLWTSSNEQGKIAGANMAGKNMEYTYPKLFSTLNLGDIKVFSAGDIVDYDNVYEYKDDTKDIHHKLFTREGKMTGVILFGDLKEMNRLRRDVLAKADVEEYLKDGLNFKML